MFKQSFYKNINVIIILGNVLAWGDFALYAYFAPILSRVFFPFTSEANAYILYSIIFALSFFFRPIGSAIAGILADKHGRKNTLLVTVTLIGVATTLIGCLPSYNQIGILSPLLLTILRIIQTMAVSAEPTNSGSLLIEQAPPEKKGLITSYVMVGIYLGFLFGIFSFLLISEHLNTEQIIAWGWRIPFISNALIAVLVAGLLINVPESPVYLAKKSKGELPLHPLRETFRRYKLPTFISFGYSVMMAVANYFLLGFIPNYLNEVIGLSLKSANLFITLSLLITVILIPFLGSLSDKVGRRPILAAGAIGFIVFSYPMLWMMASGKLQLIAISLIIYGILLAPVGAVISTALSEMFPFAVRCTASAIGYNIALVLFGGTAPIICQLLVRYTHNLDSPFWYISTIALLNLLFIIFTKETKNRNVST